MPRKNGNKQSEQPLDGEYLPADQGGKLRRFRLTDARGVRRELAAVYAQLRNGQIDVEKAKACGFLLRCLLESIRTDEIESRLSLLEKVERQ